MKLEQLQEFAGRIGFERVGPLMLETIELKQEVRDMCAGGNCMMYNKRWSCPPGCGTLEECRQQLIGYRCGILVQSVAKLEDAFDAETMMETESLHKQRVQELRQRLHEATVDALVIGAGCCTVCAQCTYPEEPCRFPDRKISSMEAFGMLVTEVCKANGIDYYYGPDTISYTSCALIL